MRNSGGFEVLCDEEKSSLIAYLKDRYNPIEDAFKNKRWLRHGNMYYIVTDGIENIDLNDIIHGGLRAVRISDSGQYKITTDFVQAFGRFFRRNVFVLRKQDVMDFLKGKAIKATVNIEDCGLTRGYVAVKTDTGDFLGCGFFDGKYVRSQIPKERTDMLVFDTKTAGADMN